MARRQSKCRLEAPQRLALLAEPQLNAPALNMGVDAPAVEL